MEDGSDIKWEDTVEFTFPITGGRVIKVYDADTITIASKLPYDASPMYRLSVRLNGIDTPEIKGKGVSDEEKESAKAARDCHADVSISARACGCGSQTVGGGSLQQRRAALGYPHVASACGLELAVGSSGKPTITTCRFSHTPGRASRLTP